jgi:hypothetical protein
MYVWLLQYWIVDAVVTREGEVVLLGVPRWKAASTSARTITAAAGAAGSSYREPNTSNDYKLVRMKAAAGSVLTSSATGAGTTSVDAATASTAAVSQDYEFAPLHVIEEIRCVLIAL